VIVIEIVLGNVRDPEWSQRLTVAQIDFLEVGQWQAQKSRFRKTTVNDIELAISLDRGTHIHDGDVLHWDGQSATAIVARIDLRDVMIVHLNELAHEPCETAMRTCIELGHAMGNQHWPALVKDNAVYVPLVIDRKVMESVMRTHRFEGIRFEFVSGREVIPYLAPHETRRLFGGAEGPVHSHTHENYAAVESETGRVYGRPPVRVHAHSGAETHSHQSPKDPAQ
jgi:urease accessory protein